MKSINKENQYPLLSIIRRYKEIKDFVKYDFKFYLRQGYSPAEAKRLIIANSTLYWLYSTDTELTDIGENLEIINKLIDVYFDDLIS